MKFSAAIKILQKYLPENQRVKKVPISERHFQKRVEDPQLKGQKIISSTGSFFFCYW
jgi:hypothetical protein